jgi:hypothetical protein
MEDGQERGEFRIEYDYRPSPEDGRRLSDALDVVLTLLLDDLRQSPSSAAHPLQPDDTE